MTIWTRWGALAVGWALVWGAGAGCADRKRAELREELDEEFERETGAIVEQSEELSRRVNELMRDHELLDARHRALDEALGGAALYDDDAAQQQAHLRQEVGHRQVIRDARLTLKRFQAVVLLHEAMEEGHGEVPLDQIVEEHERFEDDLLAYRASFDELDQQLDTARTEMERILADHDRMAERYGVPAVAP